MNTHNTLDDDAFINSIANRVMAEIERRHAKEEASSPSRLGIISAQHEAIREAGMLCSQSSCPAQCLPPSPPQCEEEGPTA